MSGVCDNSIASTHDTAGLRYKYVLVNYGVTAGARADSQRQDAETGYVPLCLNSVRVNVQRGCCNRATSIQPSPAKVTATNRHKMLIIDDESVVVESASGPMRMAVFRPKVR